MIAPKTDRAVWWPVRAKKLERRHQARQAYAFVPHGRPASRCGFQHGTLAWEASYHRRVGIESVFADLKKNRLGVHRGYFRGFGIRRYTLLAGFTLAALNILNLHDWAT